jgi:hypothetical protein
VTNAITGDSGTGNLPSVQDWYSTEFIEKFLAKHDAVTKTEIETGWLRWNDSNTVEFNQDGKMQLIDDEDLIGEDDKEENSLKKMEFDHIMQKREGQYREAMPPHNALFFSPKLLYRKAKHFIRQLLSE